MSVLSTTHQLFNRRGAPLLLAAGVFGAALLAGCGGGGGSNGNPGGGGTTGTGTTGTGTTGTGTTGTGTGGGIQNADVTGKITDVQGNGVPGATIIPDTGGTTAVSLSQGGYRLNNLTGNVVHRLTASVQQGSAQYTGSTQVLTQGGFLVSNANIVISPTNLQATVSGKVLNASGSPLPGVQVSLALPNGSPAQVGNYSSLIAFTDVNGNYTILNIPSDKPSGGALTISASIPKAQNQTFTLGTLQPGGSYSQNFTLNASAGTALAVPTVLSVTAATEPTDSQSGRALSAHAAGGAGSVYDQLRRRLSPAYARTADRTAATGKRRISHAFGDYAIETDLAFNPPPTGSILGYNVYRTLGTTTSVLPTQSAQPYDLLLDPLANYYTDVTFSTNASTTVAGSQYNFALSALNTDSQETGLSAVFSVTPLGLLTLTAPTVGQTYVGSAALAWNPVSGAQRYVVFVYDQYPAVSISPVFVSPTGTTAIAAGTTTYTITGLPPGHDYYVIVVGESDQTENLLPTTSGPVLPNAALTFSQITRFHVQ